MAPRNAGTMARMHVRSTNAIGVKRLAAVAAIAILLGACGGSSSSNPTGASTTDTVTGTLLATGSSTEDVLVGGTGVLVVTITSLSPQSNITVGLGLGLPSGSSCAILNYTATATVGSALSIPVSQGIWCWSLIDTGTVAGGVDYTVTVSHP
jgi:hypothetical protein